MDVIQCQHLLQEEKSLLGTYEEVSTIFLALSTEDNIAVLERFTVPLSSYKSIDEARKQLINKKG